MKNKNLITVLVLLIVLVSVRATTAGIFSDKGSGRYLHESIRGQFVPIHGKGLYKHMSSDVAIQGIAQDYVTLFAGIPSLLLALYFTRKGSLRGRFVLAGTVGYFWLTYLFYTAMAMYNKMFMAYVFLLGASFFTLLMILFSFDLSRIRQSFSAEKLFRAAAWFLIINAAMVASLWLSIIIPPLIKGTVYPQALQHYTTLIVQGFDLGLFLPMAIISAILVLMKNDYGYLFTPVYLVFLSLLMTALTAKIVFMARAGANVMPMVFIMPTVGLLALLFSVLLLIKVKTAAWEKCLAPG
jgi:hypothetical protein